VNVIVSDIGTHTNNALTEAVERAWRSVTSNLPHTIEGMLHRAELAVSHILDDAARCRMRELEGETQLLLQHLQDSGTMHEKRRIEEENALRDVVLHMGKLLESQRLAMNDLRTQLLLQAKAQSIAASPPQQRQRHASSKSPSQSQRINRPSSATISKRNRNASPATSRRLLFEPLSEEQIKSLYGALPTQATAVEELSVERLARITSKASLGKKATLHEQDQLILVSRTPASLLGRGSNKKVPTTLTAPLSKPSGSVHAAGDNGDHAKAYNNGELATLQELRRLRVKIDR
jgi:hypothetical protein